MALKKCSSKHARTRKCLAVIKCAHRTRTQNIPCRRSGSGFSAICTVINTTKCLPIGFSLILRESKHSCAGEITCQFHQPFQPVPARKSIRANQNVCTILAVRLTVAAFISRKSLPDHSKTPISVPALNLVSQKD